MATPELSWLIVRNNNAFLRKVRNVKQPFSSEPNNLTNKSSFRYSGIVQRKTVGVTPAADKKGFVVSLKKVKGQRKPAKLYNEVKMRQPGFRRPLKKLRNILTKNNYRKDLTKAAMVRASIILKSQQPKKKSKAKKE
ncbi:60S ribosomal protein L28 isoform X2 [Folsomia candida]|uniref:Large ribosomal subunit protein eL28 n=1 Tax=Folsomia candida TaxID=158441 RepID=A0A226E3Z2_FOLCA|nr:60S ribosomal protein L28 isoform X2 [Folsomia candida]OXA51697.1 hypothetical protein Fcan01_13443 [Folsomia candida]